MPYDPTIYVITNLEVNHNPKSPQTFRRLPIDPRLQDPKHRYVFYITDDQPSTLLPPLKETIFEAQLDPELHRLGKNHLAEWSFLLAEKKHAFCSYPFFMISSRFYAKNDWLETDLNQEWDHLFSYFKTYTHGFLPSYCRPLRWVDFSKFITNPRVFFPFTQKFFALTKELFSTKIPEDYTRFPDLGCNYIGFKDRNALLEYMNFYAPLIDFFFDSELRQKNHIEDYVRKTNLYPNEKPLTFFLEILSHLFFFKKNRPFFSLHYNGYYEVDFRNKKFKNLYKFSLPLSLRIKRKIHWGLSKEGAWWAPPIMKCWRSVKAQFPRFASWLKRRTLPT